MAAARAASPDQELFCFRNPLLARQLRNRQSHTGRQARAEALLERLDAVLPPRNRGVAELHLAVLARNRREEALARHEEALAIRRAALPAGHRDIATSLTNIGWVYRQLGKEGEAARLLEEAPAIHRAALPAEHPSIGDSEAALVEVRAVADSQL